MVNVVSELAEVSLFEVEISSIASIVLVLKLKNIKNVVSISDTEVGKVVLIIKKVNTDKKGENENQVKNI